MRSKFGIQALINHSLKIPEAAVVAEAATGVVVTHTYCCTPASVGPKIHLSDRLQQMISGANNPKEELRKY